MDGFEPPCTGVKVPCLYRLATPLYAPFYGPANRFWSDTPDSNRYARVQWSRGASFTPVSHVGVPRLQLWGGKLLGFSVQLEVGRPDSGAD